MKATPVIIIGSGGHARVLISTLREQTRDILGILHPDESLIGESVSGVPILGSDNKIIDFNPGNVEIVNGVGSVSYSEKRKNIFLRFKGMGYSFARVIHPSASVGNDVQIGEGAQILAGAIVQNGSVLGENVIVNTGSVVDHDCIIGAHAHVATGAVLSGGVQIGAMAHIGTGATIIQGIDIGPGAVVGAGAVVIKNIPEMRKAVGNPARILAI